MKKSTRMLIDIVTNIVTSLGIYAVFVFTVFREERPFTHVQGFLVVFFVFCVADIIYKIIKKRMGDKRKK